jgi:Flp pilus assembly protein TadD
MQGGFDPAVTKFQQVLADQPTNMTARLGLAGAFLGQNQYQQAVTQARLVLAAQPKNAQAHAVLGQSEINLGSTDDGLHEMETAVQLAPNNSDLRANLLADYKAAGRMAQYQALLSQSAAPAKTPAPAH